MSLFFLCKLFSSRPFDTHTIVGDFTDTRFITLSRAWFTYISNEPKAHSPNLFRCNCGRKWKINWWRHQISQNENCVTLTDKPRQRYFQDRGIKNERRDEDYHTDSSNPQTLPWISSGTHPSRSRTTLQIFICPDD